MHEDFFELTTPRIAQRYYHPRHSLLQSSSNPSEIGCHHYSRFRRVQNGEPNEFQSDVVVISRKEWEVGETGVCRDTGSRGTVGGEIEDFNKIKNIFSMLFRYMPSNLACI